MTTQLYTHPVFLQHLTGAGHPESPARLEAIATALQGPEFTTLVRKEAPAATMEQLRLVHKIGRAHV